MSDEETGRRRASERETEGQGTRPLVRPRDEQEARFLWSSFDLSLRYARICARARKRHAYAFGESRVVHRHERWIKMKEEGKLKKSRGDAPRVGKSTLRLLPARCYPPVTARVLGYFSDEYRSSR